MVGYMCECRCVSHVVHNKYSVYGTISCLFFKGTISIVCELNLQNIK